MASTFRTQVTDPSVFGPFRGNNWDRGGGKVAISFIEVFRLVPSSSEKAATGAHRRLSSNFMAERQRKIGRRIFDRYHRTQGCKLQL